MNLTKHWKAHKIQILERIKKQVKETSSLSDQVELLKLYNEIQGDLNFADKEIGKYYENKKQV